MRTVGPLLLTLSLGCASTGPTQPILVRSDPPGAEVTVECGDAKNATQLVTPTVVYVHRARDRCVVLLEKDGYLPAAVVLGKARSAWHVGNLLVGLLTGRVPDTSNAPTRNRTPSTIDVTLEKPRTGT